MSLWAWAVDAYGRDGVADACLHLQDGHDENVCLLLWAAWAAASGRALDADDLEAGVDTARAWEGSAIRPLRIVRQGLKGPIPDIENEARLALREQIKAVELEAERLLLTDLERLAPQAAGPARALAPALVEASRAWSRVIPRAALENLAAKLSA